VAFDVDNGKNLRNTMVVLPTLKDNFVWKRFLVLSYKHPQDTMIQRESRLLNDSEGHGMPLAIFYVESEKQSACDGNIIGRHADPCRLGQGTIIIREGMDPVVVLRMS
jgi:hypothetical protein